jgi:hypothetical protein
MTSIKCALVAAVLGQGSVATSEVAPTPVAATADPTVHRHFGFFLRLDTGPAFTFANEPSGSLSGGGWDFGFSIGGALAEDEILAFHTFAAVAFNSLASTASGSSSSIFTVSGFGPEYTHYFMPLNLYLSGSILFTFASLTNSQSSTSGGQTTTVTTTYSSELGGGLQLEFGKEWWVGDHWGLGMALHYAMSWNRDNTGQIVGSSSPGTLFTNSLAFVFSATYN